MRTKMTVQDRLFTTAVCLGFVIVQLDVSIVNVGLQALRNTYNATISDLEWVINTYSLLFAAFLLSSGRLGDRFGVRNVFVSGVTIFILASASCAFAPTLFMLDVARAVQGVGAALLVPSSLTLIRQYFADASSRASAIGMWAAAGGFSLAAGPIMGGTLIKLFGWKSIFLINVPVGLICILIAVKYAPAGRRNAGGLNLPGQLLIALTLGLLTFALTEAGRYGLTGSVTLASLSAGIITLVFFIWNERRSSVPVLAPSVLRNPTIVTALLIGFLCNLVFYGAVFILSIFFQTQLKLTPFEAGVSFLPMMIFTASVNFSSGWLSRYFSVKKLVAAGALISFTGFGLLLFIEADWTVWQLFIPMMLLGSGTSLAVPAMTNLIFAEASHEDAGSASALFACARQVGGVTGVALFGLLISIQGTDQLLAGLKSIAGTAIVLTLVWLWLGYVRLSNRATP